MRETQCEMDHLKGLLLVSKHYFYLFVYLLFICLFGMQLAFTRFPTEIFFHLSLLLRSFSCLNGRKHFLKAWLVNEINYTWRLWARWEPWSLDAWSDRTGLCATCSPQISHPALPRRWSSLHFWREDLSAMPRWQSLTLALYGLEWKCVLDLFNT